MKLPMYPKYKPSGVEWFGQVPEHWRLLRSDSMVNTGKRQVTPETFSGIEVMHYSIPVVQKIGTGAIENGEEIESAKQLIDSPVVLVSKLNPRKATICRAGPHDDLLTLASTEFVALNSTTGNIRFLEYLVSSDLFRQRLDSWVQSVTRSHQRVRPEKIYRFWGVWPEPQEQATIADFLDRETAKIDTLVGKKRTLIERLKEKRTALISRTVTRGLPPDAARQAGLDPHPKLKPSGVEWLGEVPEHWRLLRSDSMVNTGKRQVTPETFSGIEVMHYSIPVVQKIGTGAIENGEEIESAKQLIDSPVVLVSKLNPRKATICRAGPHDDLLTLASTEFVALNSTTGNIRFLEYLVSSDLFRQRLDSWVQSVTRSHQRVRPEKIYRFWGVWPEPQEQATIADFLDREMAKIDALVAKIETAVDRLREYRIALITTAVTGKIDVRDSVA